MLVQRSSDSAKNKGLLLAGDYVRHGAVRGGKHLVGVIVRMSGFYSSMFTKILGIRVVGKGGLIGIADTVSNDANVVKYRY